MIPLFKTHYSIGKSILRLDEIDRIITDENIDEVYLVEDSMTGFPKAYRLFGDRLRFGLRFSIYNEGGDESSESKMIAFANGDAGMKELYQLHTEMFQKKLTTPWNDYKHIVFTVPFYDSFLHKNLVGFANCMPSLPDDITFLIERNGLPFDQIIESKVSAIAQNTELVKSIYYEKKEDVEAFQTYKCICNRQAGRQAILSSPRLDHFGSDRFCIQAWKEDK